MNRLAFAPRDILLARIDELEQQVAALRDAEDDALPGVLPGAHLPPAERRILATLLRHRGRIVTHDTLAAAIHPGAGGEYADPRCVHVHVYRLRKKVDPRAVCIRNVHGLGYVMDRDVPVHAEGVPA